MAHRRKLAVWTMFLYSKQHKSYQGNLGTLKLILNPHRVQFQPWSFIRPFRVPKIDHIIFENISGCVYLFYIIHSLVLLKIWNTFLVIVELYQGLGDPLGPS